MGNSVQALHYTRHGDRRTNIKPNYAARLTRSKVMPPPRPDVGAITRHRRPDRPQLCAPPTRRPFMRAACRRTSVILYSRKAKSTVTIARCLFSAYTSKTANVCAIFCCLQHEIKTFEHLQLNYQATWWLFPFPV